MDHCTHDFIDNAAVDADGFCPICQQAELDRLRAELAAKDARIAELECALTAEGDCWQSAFDRAERAEARIALEQMDREIAEKYRREAVASRDWQLNKASEFLARAERAEADADSLRATIDNMRAMNIKLTFEATGKVLAAEAERDALRRVLEKIASCQSYHADDVVSLARAALNPSPAD